MTDSAASGAARLSQATYAEPARSAPMATTVPARPAGLLLEHLAKQWPPEAWQDLTVLVAVSGGGDSVALLRALVALRDERSPGRLLVAHYNHRWRAEQSDADEQFVRELSNQLGLELLVERAARADLGRSEAEARSARYRFMSRAAHESGARYVALAHTADDQAETVLHRLLRGTGLTGLRGMPTTRRLSRLTALIRPLLGVRRALLRAYLHQIEQPFCSDVSNQDLRRTRNRIRLELIPHLEACYNREVVAALTRLASLAGELQTVVDQLVDQLVQDAVVDSGAADSTVEIRCERLAGQPPYLVRQLLKRLWAQSGWPEQQMSYRHWLALGELLAQDAPARQTLPGNIDARRHGNMLRLNRR